ncbi:hypothetical protein H7F51_13730 [Novosphingobium flavum]|uniref:Uncharacterized protein n=1 Tax=Novosphingobium flavum TaxID=1778672 RepID=A0A7X1FTJ6_9SPHN|nr:hypothetical protein [Novosphingobium flavum]MBC2666579.1 hypothetical protein [Novosphingobium flavum]
MDKAERAQIRLLLDHHGDELRRHYAEQLKAMHADHAARGVLKSGATIKEALRIAEDLTVTYIKTIVEAVADVAQNIRAFNSIYTDVTILLGDLKRGVDDSVELAVGSGERGRSARSEANRLYLAFQQRALRLVEIHRLSFTKPSPNDMQRMGIGSIAAPAASITQPAPPKNNGGKPLAAHWDAMWADIAVQLYVGDLKPKSQKEIKDAIFAWFNAKSIDVGDTAVTDRARQLWQKIEASQ